MKDVSASRVALAFARQSSSIETMPSMKKRPEGKTVIVPPLEPPEDTGRFSEDDGIREEKDEAQKEHEKALAAPRILLDGSTDQGYRPAPSLKPARRDPLNETDTREWRRDYQEEYRNNN